MFLAPAERIRSLWPQLEERLTRDFGRLIEVDSERKCVRVDGTQRHLMIASWGGLLDSMAARSRDDGELGVETEIRQLRSLAKHADTGALKPVRRGEEFGAYSEARQRLYKRLIDAATERDCGQHLAATGTEGTSGLPAPSSGSGSTLISLKALLTRPSGLTSTTVSKMFRPGCAEHWGCRMVIGDRST